MLTRYEDLYRLIELHRVEPGSKLHDAIRRNCIFNTNNLWVSSKTRVAQQNLI